MKVKDEAAGRKGKCTKCGESVRVPNESTVTDPHELQVPAAPELVVVAAPREDSFPAIAPVANVQVNVQQSKASHSLGIASLVLGILSLFVCWLPFIGTSLAGLGFLLGASGLVMAVLRKGTGIGYSIAGTAVSGVALLIGGIWTVAFSGAVAEADRAITQAGQAVQDAAEKSKQSDTSSNKTPVGHKKPTSNKKKPPPWRPANVAQQVGNVRVSIENVIVGTVPLFNSILDRKSESKDKLLTVWLKIENVSNRKKIDYSGWMDQFASLRDIDATLTDDADNRYRSVRFSATSAVEGAKANSSIYPGKSIKDAVVFELPVKGVKFLRLKLSGRAFGSKDDLRFEIPGSMIQKQ